MASELFVVGFIVGGGADGMGGMSNDGSCVGTNVLKSRGFESFSVSSSFAVTPPDEIAPVVALACLLDGLIGTLYHLFSE